MKKFLMLAVLCAFATSLVGCTEATPSKASVAPKVSDTTKPGEKPAEKPADKPK